MAVTIRLARIGKKNSPTYKVVVSNTRDKRNGKFLDILGFYNPIEKPALIEVDKKKVEEWKKKGAQVSDAVDKILAGSYVYKKYNPKGDKKEEKNEAEASA